MNFDEAFERVIGHEGGLVNDPKDPGGLTKYGISQRAYPKLDIAALTLEQAKTLYLTDYWLRCGIDLLPGTLRFSVFDMAVNSGPRAAATTLQKALGVTPDGVIGPVTRAAIGKFNPIQMVARFNGARLAFMADLSTWPAFGRGWARRVADNLMRL